MKRATPGGPIVAALLAAGSATRFGGGKLDVQISGKPLGRHALDTLMQLDIDQRLLIVPPHIPAFAAATLPENVTMIINQAASDGMGTSLSCAAQHAMQLGAAALIVALADMPLISTQTLKALLPQPGEDVKMALRAVQYPDGRAGPPALFGAHWLPELATLSADQGARALLQREGNSLTLVALSEREAFDLDRKADLVMLEKWMEA